MITKRKPTHPGLVLKHDVLEPLNLTVSETARRLCVTHNTLSELINCRAALSPEMAIRIGKATGTTPASWLNIQTKLDLRIAQKHTPNVKRLEVIAG